MNMNAILLVVASLCAIGLIGCYLSVFTNRENEAIDLGRTAFKLGDELVSKETPFSPIYVIVSVNCSDISNYYYLAKKDTLNTNAPVSIRLAESTILDDFVLYSAEATALSLYTDNMRVVKFPAYTKGSILTKVGDSEKYEITETYPAQNIYVLLRSNYKGFQYERYERVSQQELASCYRVLKEEQ